MVGIHASPSVLVVDDDVTIRMLVRVVLEGHGCNVTEAECGAEALSACSDAMPDFVFLDAILPDADGFTLCQQIRAMPQGIGTPIIMATGLESAQEKAREVGATACITKPIDIGALQKIVARLVRQHG